MRRKLTQVRGIRGVFFHAKWCASCEKMLPFVQRLRRQGFMIDIWNYDINKIQVNLHKVKTLPTFIVLDNRGEIKRWEEFVKEEDIRRFLTRQTHDYNI